MHPKLPFSPNFHKQHHHQLLQQGCAPPPPPPVCPGLQDVDGGHQGGGHQGGGHPVGHTPGCDSDPVSDCSTRWVFRLSTNRRQCLVRSLLNMSCIMGIVWVMYSYSGPYLKPILTLRRFLCNILIHNIRSVEKLQRLLK